MTEALLTESKERPAGRLKVTTTVGFGSTWLAPRFSQFFEMYPDVSISLLLDDLELDLAMREADVAIRMHPPRQPDLIQRHLMTIQWQVCASAEYLKQFGVPQRAEDLDAHRLILFGDHHPPVPDINWLADAGLSENQDLVRVLPDLNAPQVDVYFVYPEELRNSKRVAVFRDFLLARLAELHPTPAQFAASS
jgi:DNA-binding transcriptional LysR family regulator